MKAWYENHLDYNELGKQMLSDLKKLRKLHPEKNIIQICAPISTGGRSSITENLKFLKSAIKTVNVQKFLLFDEPYGSPFQKLDGACIVFDQSPYEDAVFHIKNKRKEKSLWSEYDYEILEICYRPLFKSKIFDGLIFLPEFNSSIDAMVEMNLAKEFDIPDYRWNQISFSL